MSDLEYDLIRSRRKTLALEVTREGKVLVRAPVRLAKSRIDDFVRQHAGWVQKHQAIQEKRREAHPEPTEAEQEELIRRAKEILPKKVEQYGRLMGLHPTGITITGARKRFGSCSGKDRICFSWRLMQYPEEAVDYVVVHELAHIRHKDHSGAFYACVEKTLPDWRERRNLLRE